MALPTLTGLTKLRDIEDDLTGVTSNKGLVYNDNSNFIYTNDQVDVNEVIWFELEFTTTGVQDLSNSIIVFAFNNRFNESSIKVGLVTTGNTNYRQWEIGTVKLEDNIVILNPSEGAFTDTGTFDITSVIGFRFEFIASTFSASGGATRAAIDVLSNIFSCSQDGVTIGDGEVSNPANLKFLYDQFSANIPVPAQPTNQKATLFNFFQDTLRFPLPLRIGDNSSVLMGNQRGSLVFSANDQGNETGLLLLGPRRLTFDISSPTEIVKDFFSENTIDSFEFRDLSSAQVTYTGDFSNYSVFEAGLNSVFIGNNFSGQSKIQGGNAFTNCIFDESSSDIVLSWNGSATLQNCEFKGTQDHYIELDGSNFNDNDTLDLTGVTFSGSPAISAIKLDAAGKTINITVAKGSGVTLSDVTVINGTANIQSEPLKFKGFPTSANANGVSPAPVLGIRNESGVWSTYDITGGEIDIDLSQLGSGPFYAVSDAKGWIRTPEIEIQASRTTDVDFSPLFQEILGEDGTPLVGLGVQSEKDKIVYDQLNARFEVDGGGVSFNSVLDKKEDLTSSRTGLEIFDADTVRSIAFIQNAYANTILLPSPLKISANDTTTESPVLLDFVIARLGDAGVDVFEHLPGRPEVRQLQTKFIVNDATDSFGESNNKILQAILGLVA